MANNTNELTAKLKAAAEKAKAARARLELTPDEDVVLLEEDDITSDVCACNKFFALANPAAVLELIAELEAAQKRIAELEARTLSVKLPKPHAHLIWIQAGRGPDDYWDDVAVSHSLRDRCCDGSERYPVYSIFEIQEVCAAAGINLETGGEA
ncbi:ead/Ea22-like family protein [Cronobacter turicensis]